MTPSLTKAGRNNTVDASIGSAAAVDSASPVILRLLAKHPLAYTRLVSFDGDVPGRLFLKDLFTFGVGLVCWPLIVPEFHNLFPCSH